MNPLFRLLACVNNGAFVAVGLVCAALGIPNGKARRAIEYVAQLGATTVVVTATFTIFAGFVLGVINSPHGAFAAGRAFLGTFSLTTVGLIGLIAFILALMAILTPG